MHKFAMHQKVHIKVIVGDFIYEEDGIVVQQLQGANGNFNYLVMCDKAFKEQQPVHIGGTKYESIVPYFEYELEPA